MTKVKVFGMPMSLVTVKDPWYNVAYYLKRLPPWARELQHWMAIIQRPAMARAVAAFTVAAKATAGIDRWQRREILSKVLRKGPGAYGGKVREKKPALSESELNALLSRVQGRVSQITASTPVSDALRMATEAVRGGA